VFVSCAAFTSFDIPPPMEERAHHSTGGVVLEMMLVPKRATQPDS
jgi:hypothetical protein